MVIEHSVRPANLLEVDVRAGLAQIRHMLTGEVSLCPSSLGLRVVKNRIACADWTSSFHCVLIHARVRHNS